MSHLFGYGSMILSLGVYIINYDGIFDKFIHTIKTLGFEKCLRNIFLRLYRYYFEFYTNNHNDLSSNAMSPQIQLFSE